MRSAQTLSVDDRRTLAWWAADCAEHVLALFEAAVPGNLRPRESIARTRAFARGERPVGEEIRPRFVGGGAAREVQASAATASAAAASAAARAAGQAAAVAHMGAHALGAAAYAARRRTLRPRASGGGHR